MFVRRRRRLLSTARYSLFDALFIGRKLFSTTRIKFFFPSRLELRFKHITFINFVNLSYDPYAVCHWTSILLIGWSLKSLNPWIDWTFFYFRDNNNFFYLNFHFFCVYVIRMVKFKIKSVREKRLRKKTHKNIVYVFTKSLLMRNTPARKILIKEIYDKLNSSNYLIRFVIKKVILNYYKVASSQVDWCLFTLTT